MNLIYKLENLDLKNSSPNDIRNLLSNHRIAYVSYPINVGEWILRARKGDNFVKREDLTYCPLSQSRSMQRCSLPGTTMFYGVISETFTLQEYAHAVATSECSQLCKEGINSIGKEKFCVSYWEVIKPLNVASFITDSTFINCNNNTMLTDIRDNFQLKMKQKLTLEELNLLNFISQDFGKFVDFNNNHEYLISATITTDIITKMGLDGVIYPSVKLSGQGGLNIALTTKATDEKLRFKKVIKQTLYKNKDLSYICFESITEKDKTTIIEDISDLKLNELLGGIDINDLMFV